MKYFKTYEAYRLGVNGVGSLRNSLAALKRQNINGRYVDPEILAQAIRNEYEAITGERYEDEVQMSMDNTIADIIGHYKLDGPDFMAAWDKVVKESVVTEGKMSKEKIEDMIWSLENEVKSWHPSSDSKKRSQIDKLKKDLSKFESIVNEASDQQRLTHLRKFGIAPNNQPQNAAYIKQVSKPGKFFVDWKDAFKLGDVALEFIKSVGSISEFDIIDLKTMKRTGKQLDVKKGQLGNLRTTYGVRVNESVNEAEFKHINKDEHAIKLAIKDVEKKARLKANRDKPLEYEQLSLNKIMLSKVLGREKLGKEHQAAWKKLKKEYSLKESVNEAKGGQIMPGDYVKNQHGNIYQRVDGKVGRHDAYVRVTNGKSGKRKTGLHDSFKLTLVNKYGLEESVDE